MRTFNFKARNIGQEKYLTYTMGAECELDEDVLDYCEENNVKELIGIIYEEDDDYDYLTYDITGRTSLEEYIKAEEMSVEKVLFILRNVANSLICLKEQAIHLSYVLMNRSFMYIDKDSYDISFICLPIESKGSVAVEFKSFIRQLLANMKYDIHEELGYVGKLLTYINGDSFNLRGLIGLSEALMEEAGIGYEEAGTIDADGVEVIDDEVVEASNNVENDNNVADFMNALSEQDAVLPEIGDDEDTEEDEYEDGEPDEELESILPAGMDVAIDEDSDNVDEIEDAGLESPEVEAVVETETIPETGTAPEVEMVPETEAVNVDELEVEEDLKPEAAVAEDIAEQTKVPEIKLEAKPEDNETVTQETVEKTQKISPEIKRQKEADVNLIKNRIKELVGDVPSAKPSSGSGKSIKTLEELDEFLGSRPPVVKKNVVKVNRAALIQSAAEAEAEQEARDKSSGDNPTENIKVPVIGDVYEDAGAEAGEADEKPKSNSVLSKTVAEPVKTSNLINIPKAVPYLVRVNTEERIMLGKVTFKLGKASRGVDYTVSGNAAISRQHAVIIQRDGVCYIKDNKSTNHTYVNGRVVEDGVEEILTHDSMIKLGDEEFIFKIR